MYRFSGIGFLFLFFFPFCYLPLSPSLFSNEVTGLASSWVGWELGLHLVLLILKVIYLFIYLFCFLS